MSAAAKVNRWTIRRGSDPGIAELVRDHNALVDRHNALLDLAYGPAGLNAAGAGSASSGAAGDVSDDASSPDRQEVIA